MLIQLKISENSSRVLQVTNVNLSLVQILLKLAPLRVKLHYPQQDSSSAYMRIHHIHVINIDVTYIASYIITLHATNSLPFRKDQSTN